MIGLLVGIIAGAIQLYMLMQFSAFISKGIMHGKALMFGALQFFMPMIVLLGVAVFRRQDLIWAAIGMSGILLVGAVVKFVIYMRGRKENNE
ncbi:hypothetical protein AAFA46_09715 [Oscillospiraceae bacterium WX1]